MVLREGDRIKVRARELGRIVATSSVGGHYVCAGRLDILKLD